MSIIAKTEYLEFKKTKFFENKYWSYVNRTNDTNTHDSAVVLTTIVKNNNKYYILLLKTKRPPIYTENKAQFCLESPAGLIGDINKKEDLMTCAKKELEEETGFVESKMYIELLNSSTSSGLSSETLSYITVITDINNLKKTPVNDDGIIVDRLYIELDKIDEYINSIDKKIYSVSSSLICGLYFAKIRIKNLKN